MYFNKDLKLEDEELVSVVVTKKNTYIALISSQSECESSSRDLDLIESTSSDMSDDDKTSTR